MERVDLADVANRARSGRSVETQNVNADDDTEVLLQATYSAFGERTVITGDPDGVAVGFAEDCLMRILD